MNRLRSLVLLGALLALELLVPACGVHGSASAQASDPVRATADRLGRLRSATLDLTLSATAGADAAATPPVGFRLQGAFAPPTADRALPVAHLETTRLAGARRTTSTFVSDGTRAVVVVDGKPVPLRPDQLDGLRGSTSGTANLGGLHLDRWFATRDQRTDGATTTVSGSLDAPAAVNDVLGLADGFGNDSPAKPTAGDDVARVRSLVRSSSIQLVTGTSDHVLRSLRFDVSFGGGPDADRLPPSLRGASLHFELSLTDVGRAVHVDVP